MASHKPSPKLSSFKVIGFDTMGTLLDEKTGVITASTAILSRLPEDVSEDDLFFAFEDALQQHIKNNKPPISYNTLLEKAIIDASKKFSKDDDLVTSAEARKFAEALARWPPFPDTVSSLQFLASQGYKLVLLSNMDTSTLERIADKQTGSFRDISLSALLGGDSSGGFKPDHAVNQNLLDTAQKKYNVNKEQVLLVAQGLESDHVPAEEMGLSSAWIDRYGHGKQAIPAKADPNWVFTSLAELCEEIENEINRY